MIDVFLTASKGIPARYGGFETFVERLVRGKTSDRIKYHVSCMAQGKDKNEMKRFEYEGADCFPVKVPLPGAPGRILHVSLALSQIAEWKKEHPDSDTIVYILGCRIGPLMKYHAKRLRALGVKIYVNPDGLEWKRAKWNMAAKRFLHYCESCLVTNADLVICDAKAIERYIQKAYKNKVQHTTYLAYGADLKENAEISITDTMISAAEGTVINDAADTVKNAAAGASTDHIADGNLNGISVKEEYYKKWEKWCQNKEISSQGYYLIVGRFVPDNNYETVIREFMKSESKRDLVIISNVEKNKFYEQLKKNTRFLNDSRIKFVGTVYDESLLFIIRERAYGYFHGHEVGGTNPSLLEALATTDLNLVLDVEFGREVAGDGAKYWTKEDGNLCCLIKEVEQMRSEERKLLGDRAKERIRNYYSWEKIVRDYEDLFMGRA